MAAFDSYINEVHTFTGELREQKRELRDLAFSSDPSSLSEVPPIKIGPGASSGIVLKSDTFVELGSPTAGSCALLLYSDNPSLISDGRIVLIGPGIQESRSASLPFGQVIMVGGEDLTEADYQNLVQSQYVSDEIEGYMLRSTTEHIWGRVSNDAGRKGFDFQFLGSALISLLKLHFPKAVSVEVLFVTSSKDDLERLDEIATQAAMAAQEIKARIWKARGVDIFACVPGGHCGKCKDKEACDSIRKMTAVRQRAQHATSEAK